MERIKTQKQRGFILTLLISVVVPPALADLPLTLEDLLTAQQRWRVELGVAYANSDTTGVESGNPVLIQTGPT